MAVKKAINTAYDTWIYTHKRLMTPTIFWLQQPMTQLILRLRFEFQGFFHQTQNCFMDTNFMSSYFTDRTPPAEPNPVEHIQVPT